MYSKTSYFETVNPNWQKCAYSIYLTTYMHNDRSITFKGYFSSRSFP